MRIKGIIKTREGIKEYVIYDRNRYSRIPLINIWLKVKDYPEIIKSDNIKEAKLKLMLVIEWFNNKTFCNEADMPIIN